MQSHMCSCILALACCSTGSQCYTKKTLTLLGSMVQKGKFSAGMDTLPRVLKRVLLPTLGKPTIPICTIILRLTVAIILIAGHWSWAKTRMHATEINGNTARNFRTFKLDLNLPSTGFSTGSSFFLGGILRASHWLMGTQEDLATLTPYRLRRCDLLVSSTQLKLAKRHTTKMQRIGSLQVWLL